MKEEEKRKIQEETAEKLAPFIMCDNCPKATKCRTQKHDCIDLLLEIVRGKTWN